LFKAVPCANSISCILLSLSKARAFSTLPHHRYVPLGCGIRILCLGGFLAQGTCPEEQTTGSVNKKCDRSCAIQTKEAFTEAERAEFVSQRGREIDTGVEK